ncbi:MAG: sigma-70 family RNA polymerase sigma factor [Chitinispirillaceae bacterium]|nr:sigma-70 family RNA polymerase sigma factor [Chitinispirillaceae bacterium]
MDETRLITAARKGDQAALTELLLTHRDLVAGVVTRAVYDPDSRKDVIQSIFLKVVATIGSFRGTCKFSTWLYRLSINEAIEQNRCKLRWNRLQEALTNNRPLFPDPDSSDELEAFSRKEITHAVNDALNGVSLDKKTAFFLFYIAGYSGKEAAEQMKISPENFFMKLKAARDHVKKVLIDKGWNHG